MNVEIGTGPAHFLFWEYLLRIFGSIVSFSISSHICTVDNIELRVFCYTVKMYQLCNIFNKSLLVLKQSLEKFE